MQTWLLLYTPDLGNNTFLSLSQGASTLLPTSLPPPYALVFPSLLSRLLFWCIYAASTLKLSNRYAFNVKDVKVIKYICFTFQLQVAQPAL